MCAGARPFLVGAPGLQGLLARALPGGHHRIRHDRAKWALHNALQAMSLQAMSLEAQCEVHNLFLHSMKQRAHSSWAARAANGKGWFLAQGFLSLSCAVGPTEVVRHQRGHTA